MIRQFGSIALTEAMMARRTWRFWLILVLLLGILYLTWKDHVAFVEADMYLAPDHSFGSRGYFESTNLNRPWIGRTVENRGASLSLVIAWVGGVALALDACGRLRRTGMDKILFPRPFSTIGFVVGRFLGILLVILPLSAIPWLGFGVLQYYYGHADIIWQPFVLCYLFVVLPVLVPLVALALWVRLSFKHDIVAVFVVLLFVFSFSFLAPTVSRQLTQNWTLLKQCSPSLGASLEWFDQVPVIAVQIVVTVLFLLLAPFHLRRQEPQRRLLRRRGYRWFSIPTFVRWFSDLKVDRNLPAVLKVTVVLYLILMGGGGYALVKLQDTAKETKAQYEARQSIERQPPPATPYDVLSYEISAALDFQKDRIESVSTVRLRSATESLPVVSFLLNPGLKIQELTASGGALAYAVNGQILSVTMPQPLQSGEPFEFRLSAKGPIFDYGRNELELHGGFGRLRAGKWWYPVQYTPWVFVSDRDRRRTVSLARPDLFDATVAVMLPAGAEVVFPGDEIAREQMDSLQRVTYRTPHPVAELQLMWGRYAYVDAEFANIPCRFFHLPGHRYQAQIFLEEMKDGQAVVREKLGSLPFPRLTLCETPMYKRTSEADMAGLFSVNEQSLVYLHEGIWDLERYDLKPTEVDFYQRLEGIVQSLGWEYRAFLVTTYFDKTFHASGPYAFWLDTYLSSYIGKLLEPNAWRRRFLFDYAVGSQRDLYAASVGRPLLEIRNEEPESNAEKFRGESIFRMLHHLLDEDGWWTFVRRLLEEYRFKNVSDQDIIRLVNEVSGESLDWFFDQWLYGDVLPRYEITLAEATVVRKPRSIQVEYDVRVTVKNHQTGRMAVPIYVETERDQILRDVWLDAEEQHTLTMVVPNRPMFAMVDPENWILQELPFNEENKSRVRSEKKFNILQPSERKERGTRVATEEKGSLSQ